jgi:rare lipoprotein A
MKQLSASFLLLCMAAFAAPAQAAAQGGELFRQEGIASWYGPEFDGRPTASGEIFNSAQYTAAHPTLPFGTVLLVTNRHNNKQITVTVNDRGPFVAARIIDVSRAAAEQLDMLLTGTAPVIIEGAVPYGSGWSGTEQSAPTPTPAPAPIPVVTVPAIPPSYDRGEYYRVVLAGLRGDEVPSVTEKLASAGFREAVIREDK